MGLAPSSIRSLTSFFPIVDASRHQYTRDRHAIADLRYSCSFFSNPLKFDYLLLLTSNQTKLRVGPYDPCMMDLLSELSLSAEGGGGFDNSTWTRYMYADLSIHCHWHCICMRNTITQAQYIHMGLPLRVLKKEAGIVKGRRMELSTPNAHLSVCSIYLLQQWVAYAPCASKMSC